MSQRTPNIDPAQRFWYPGQPVLITLSAFFEMDQQSLVALPSLCGVAGGEAISVCFTQKKQMQGSYLAGRGPQVTARSRGMARGPAACPQPSCLPLE